MKLTDLLTGRKILYMTDAKVEVELEIKLAEEVNNSRNLEPATKENDWWPKFETWTTYRITFTNGFVKIFNNLGEIKLVEN